MGAYHLKFLMLFNPAFQIKYKYLHLISTYWSKVKCEFSNILMFPISRRTVSNSFGSVDWSQLYTSSNNMKRSSDYRIKSFYSRIMQINRLVDLFHNHTILLSQNILLFGRVGVFWGWVGVFFIFVCVFVRCRLIVPFSVSSSPTLILAILMC